MEKLTQEMKLAHLFLKGAYPKSQGWVLSRNAEVNGLRVAFVFRKENNWVLVPPIARVPYVSKKSVAQANRIKEHFQTENQGSNVQVLLFYNRLIMPPGNLPQNILVFSLDEEQPEENTEQLILN